MSERVQQLLYEVQRAASEEQYKVSLAQRFPNAHERGLREVQREIAEEIAHSLGRAGAKIERSLRVLHGLLTKAAASGLTAEESRQVEDAFYRERRQTELHLRDLLIQREALGFLRHDDVKQRYPLPSWGPATGEIVSGA
jgi:hypothetical protein